MDIVITKIYRCGNSMGVTFLNENDQLISTLVGPWDSTTARRATHPDTGRIALHGKARAKIYEITETNIKEVRERRIKQAYGLRADEQLATTRQVNYAFDLALRFDRGEWCTTLGAQFFKNRPSRRDIAGMSKKQCSQFISNLKTRY